MKYVFIYKDNYKKISYYYNLDNNLVYENNSKNNRCNFLGILGIIIGFICYLVIGIISFYFSYSSLFIVIMGILFGIIIALIANRTINDIFKQKGRKVSSSSLVKMNKENKNFRIKYFILVIAFLIFTLLSLIFYENKMMINFILLTSIIMFTFLLILYRPLNYLKFLKMLRR